MQEKYKDLVLKATEEVEPSEGSHSIDQNRLWIEAAGGVKKGRILGMGSEAESMMELAHYVHQPRPISSLQVDDTFKYDLMAKVNNLEQQLSEKFSRMEKHVDRSVESAREEARLNLEMVQQNHQMSMDSWEKKLDMFISKIGGCFLEKGISK